MYSGGGGRRCVRLGFSFSKGETLAQTLVVAGIIGMISSYCVEQHTDRIVTLERFEREVRAFAPNLPDFPDHQTWLSHQVASQHMNMQWPQLSSLPMRPVQVRAPQTFSKIMCGTNWWLKNVMSDILTFPTSSIFSAPDLYPLTGQKVPKMLERLVFTMSTTQANC